MSTLIRYANLDDSAVLGRILSESSQAGFKDVIPDHILNDIFSVERRTERFISELSEGSPRTIIAFNENEAAGLISFGKPRDDNSEKSCVEIWRVYLLPKFWGSGISKELIEWGIKEILKEGLTNIELWVLEENIRARNFYEKIGFQYDNTFRITNMGGKEVKELRYIIAHQ